jgi:hypothetical protein
MTNSTRAITLSKLVLSKLPKHYMHIIPYSHKQACKVLGISIQNSRRTNRFCNLA